jgi:hypothetical protein
MALKFSCPHCRKGIQVKEELAGRKGKCPYCHQLVRIPSAATSSAPSPAKRSTESDIEALALAALGEKEKTKPGPGTDSANSKKIEFQCPMCDEKISLSADLAGKRAPCPECRRIIKVPLLEKNEPKDWRKVDVRNPLARDLKGEPAPEGAWGTAIGGGRVSRQALLEAGALPVVKEKWTVRQWTHRVALGIGVAFVLVVGVWAVMHFGSQSRKSGAFSQAAKLVAESKDPLTAAETYRGLGVYQFRSEKPSGDSNSAQAARDYFRKARAKLTEDNSSERDAILIDVALDQLDLGSDSEEAQKRGIRLKWDDVILEVRRTLQEIKSPEARLMGLRQVEGKLINLNLPNFAARLPDAVLDPNDPHRAEALAQYGLLIIDQKEQANAQATQALQASKPSKKNEKEPAFSLPASVIALLVALDRKDVKELTPPKSNPPLDVRVGYTWGLAYRGQVGEARALATSEGPASHQLQALIALVDALIDKNADIEVDLKAAVEKVEPVLKEKESNVSSWTLYHLVRLAVRGDKLVLAQKLADLIPDGSLRNLAKLEYIQTGVDNVVATPPGALVYSKDFNMDALEYFINQDPPCRHALLESARRGTRTSGSSTVSESVQRWGKPELRPLGYAGIALGMQDAEK